MPVHTVQMQMSLNLNSCVHIFEYLRLLAFHTAVSSFYHSASWGMSRGYSKKCTHTHTHTLCSEKWIIGGWGPEDLHTIHNHLETTANASTKAKLKVEPLNSLDSSLFPSFLQMVLVLKSFIFSLLYEIHMRLHTSSRSRYSFLYLDQIWRQSGASVLSQAARLHGSCSLTALIRRLVKISGLSGKCGCGCGCGHPPSCLPS